MYSISIPSPVHNQAVKHLLRSDGQEDLCFALWYPSTGQKRTTALVHSLILPFENERNVHGNVSFTSGYFERSLIKAIQANAGLALMHSHPGSRGWQRMSADDIKAEQGHAGAVNGATDLLFVGLTMGSDSAWSARFWEKIAPRNYKATWCKSVRVVGEKFNITLHPDQKTDFLFREELTRTVSAWGSEAQSTLTNLTVGVVGAGSVGSIVAETLARIGVGHIILLDFDTVKKINLDRLMFATQRDVNLRHAKVEVLAKGIQKSATAGEFVVEPLQWSVAEEAGFNRVLDCDILFSCVDRPLPRSILNYIAHAHLIPVVDGGIFVKASENKKLKHADWRAHIAIPTRPCLECLEQYDPGQVSVDREGLFDDPSYIQGLPDNHPLKRNENVFAFSLSAASFEILQFLSFIVDPMGLGNLLGAQIYHFVNGSLDSNVMEECRAECCYANDYLAKGDRGGLIVTSSHLAAEQARSERLSYQQTWKYKLRKQLSKISDLLLTI